MKDEVFINYATALFSLAKNENKVEIYLKEMKEVTEVLTSSPEILETFSSYRLSKEELYQLLDESFKKLESPSLLPFLKLLLSKHLLSSIREISADFYTLCNDYLGIKEGIIYSTKPLSKDEVTKIEDILGKKLNSKIYLKNRIDLNIIGGVKVVLDGKIYDGSVARKVENLRNELLKGDAI